MKKKFVRVYNHFTDHGFAATVQLIETRLRLLMRKRRQESQTDAVAVINAHFPNLIPLPVYSVPKGNPCSRITLVTDSISSSSFFGGVATAIIFAAQLAEARNVRLRIVTRLERPDSTNMRNFLASQGVTLSHEIEFAFSPLLLSNVDIDIFDDELFVTTSWWTTASTLGSVNPEYIIYLLQEDERIFYPFGDDRLRCMEIMKNDKITFVLNTQLLFDFLVNDGFDNIAKNGMYFEPAFPREIFKRKPRDPSSKYQLMFYARPNNPRNIFYTGIKILSDAIDTGVIDLKQWDIVFIGKHIPKISFSNGYMPIHRENLSWTEYAELIGQMDLGLTLMYSPHPSYPPLDVVAGGAVAVTNRYANKQDLSRYSNNILCGDLDHKSLLDTLKSGVNLAMNDVERRKNANESPLLSDWKVALSHVVEHLARGMK